jgi:rhodanese-related sulfurtransferase
MQEISATEAADLLSSEPGNIVLLDVREADELQVAAVEGAVHIPMAEIPARLSELDKNKTIVCICHSGGRSAHVAAFLLDQGYERVINLAGGIDGWSTEVDGSVPRY